MERVAAALLLGYRVTVAVASGAGRRLVGETASLPPLRALSQSLLPRSSSSRVGCWTAPSTGAFCRSYKSWRKGGSGSGGGSKVGGRGRRVGMPGKHGKLRPTAPLIPAAAQASSQMEIGKKRKVRDEARGQFDRFAKEGNAAEALKLWEVVQKEGRQLSLHTYNVLLHLCATAGEGDSLVLYKQTALTVYHKMLAAGMRPSEATFGALSKCAAATGDSAQAVEFIHKMIASGIPPRLRSYAPALQCMCARDELDRAFGLLQEMSAQKVVPSEVEYAALLGLGARKQAAQHVLERWFLSPAAQGAPQAGSEAATSRDTIERKYQVDRATITEESGGVCSACGSRLISIDLTPDERQQFAKGIAEVALQRETRENEFTRFQEWLQRHGPFEAIVDGANVALFGQNYEGGGFSFNQVETVCTELQEAGKLNRAPLVLLFEKRTRNGPASTPEAQRFLNQLRQQGALFCTPPGSNDDWYWIYAAVTQEAYLVTNDEMRDHLFQLLSPKYFLTWKERSQVRFAFDKDSQLQLIYPPSFSVCIQETADHSWHFPTQAEGQWLCASNIAAKRLQPDTDDMSSLVEPSLVDAAG
eukprot:jgi/Chlat1/5200/Chrsp33S05178